MRSGDSNRFCADSPGNIAALSNLGVIYSRTSRADEAIAVYRRALKLSPDDKAILLNLGLVYLKQEAHSRALPLFARVVAIDPQHLQARQLLAVCRVYTGATGAGDPRSRGPARRGSADDGILFLLGFAYLKTSRRRKGEGDFSTDVRGGGRGAGTVPAG